MQAILWITILIFCGALTLSPRTTVMTDAATRAESVADEMDYYHVMATKACQVTTASCSAGEIALTTRPGATSAYGARVVSFTDGSTYIATTLILNATTDNIAQTTEFVGWITHHLMNNVSSSNAIGEMVGTYSTITQQAQVYPGYIGAESYTTDYSISQGMAGVTFINHQPVLITPIY